MLFYTSLDSKFGLIAEEHATAGGLAMAKVFSWSLVHNLRNTLSKLFKKVERNINDYLNCIWKIREIEYLQFRREVEVDIQEDVRPIFYRIVLNRPFKSFNLNII